MPDLLDSPPVRPRTSSPRSTTTAARSSASATASTAADRRRDVVSRPRLPRRQRPRRQRRRRGARARSRSRPRRTVLDRRGPEPARRDRRHSSRDDRGGAPARAAGVPRRAVPRRHRGGLGARPPARLPTCRAPWRRTAGRAAGTRSSSPSTRSTAPTSSTLPDGRTRPRARLRGARPRVPHPLPARRLRPRAAAAALRPARDRARGLRRARPLPHGRRPGGPRRALGAACSRTARRGFFHPEQLHVRPGRLPEPALRRRRARRGRRLGASSGVFQRYGQRGRRRARDAACSRSRRGRSRGSTTTRASSSTACSASSPREARHEPAAAASRHARDAARSRTGRRCRDRYRIGTYATFRESMLEALSAPGGLARLTTRRDDDYAITMLDLWAAVADVLDLLPGALRERGVPAHRDAARVGRAPRAR